MSSDALWYRDAIFYEIRVRSFFDRNGDGIGDFGGLTEKLDYVQDLGVTALWLLPFYPSPLKDDGYDVASYTDIHPECGTLKDFRTFVREAHRRGLRVVTELVLNHTSDQHPWFQRARRAPPGSKHRDFYVWTDNPARYGSARIIFKDFETSNWAWDDVAGAYYWHRFFSHQPDLNFDNPTVRKAILNVVDTWFRMGVDGMRLDAIPYLYEREGTSCENLGETHAFLRGLRAHVDEQYGARMLLAEANQWPEDAVAYFGSGDECHMAFHFPLMPRLFMALRMESSYPILETLQETPPIPEGCQWAIFLRNHDELTLEMVTDEERAYMVRAYARDERARINLGIRRRLAPLLGNSRRRIELMNALLMSLPGTPVLYYGDELGMGDNVYLGDRNGVRTPMHWSPDRNAGFSSANPQQLILPVITDPAYHYQAVNVETQHGNPTSLLWWTRRLIALRKQFRAFGRGSFVAVRASNPRVLAFLRVWNDERILVVANLSRFSQHVELDLSSQVGRTPRELFGHSKFPPIGSSTYPLALGPHDFYWFVLRAKRSSARIDARYSDFPQASVEVEGIADGLDELFANQDDRGLATALLGYVVEQRWFRGKARRTTAARIVSSVPLRLNSTTCRMVFVEISFEDGEPETYVLGVRLAVHKDHSGSVIVQVHRRAQPDHNNWVLVDTTQEPGFAWALLELVANRPRTNGQNAMWEGVADRSLRQAVSSNDPTWKPRLLGGEQSNTNWTMGTHALLKLVRRIDEGQSPEVELGRHLTRVAHFHHVPELLGHLAVQLPGRERSTMVVIQRYVENQGDAWRMTLDELARFFERVAVVDAVSTAPVTPLQSAIECSLKEPTSLARDTVRGYLEMANLLGRRTAEMHLAMCRVEPGSELAPEPVTPLFCKSLQQSLRHLAARVFEAVAMAAPTLDPYARRAADEVLSLRETVVEKVRRIADEPFEGLRIRCHGDYHLGQVLCAGNDIVIIDFEGEPSRPLHERRIKKCPLTDVAGMLRSFDYAVRKVLHGQARSAVRPSDATALARWARFWYVSSAGEFLRAYRGQLAGSELAWTDPVRESRLLELYVFEKVLYELGYEANNRPTWLHLPLYGVLSVLGRDIEG